MPRVLRQPTALSARPNHDTSRHVEGFSLPPRDEPETSKETMSGNKFRFSLQSVLDLRAYETDKARYFLAQAVSERRAQEETVRRAEERLRELNENAPAAGDVDLQTLRQYDAFRQHARQLRDKAREQLNQFRQREDAARSNWVERRQAQESLETLHDGEKEEHDKKVAEAEMAFLDEQAVMRYCRNDNKSSLL